MLLKLKIRTVEEIFSILYGPIPFILKDFSDLKSLCNFELEREGIWIKFNLNSDAILYCNHPLFLLRKIAVSIGSYPIKVLGRSFYHDGIKSTSFHSLRMEGEKLVTLLRLSREINLDLKSMGRNGNWFNFKSNHPIDKNIAQNIEAFLEKYCLESRHIFILPPNFKIKLKNDFSSIFNKDLSEKIKLLVLGEGIQISPDEKTAVIPKYRVNFDEDDLYDLVMSLLWREINCLDGKMNKINYLDLSICRPLLTAWGYLGSYSSPLSSKGFRKVGRRNLFLGSRLNSFDRKVWDYIESDKNKYLILSLRSSKKNKGEDFSHFKGEILDLIDYCTGGYISCFKGKKILSGTLEVGRIIFENFWVRAVINLRLLFKIPQNLNPTKEKIREVCFIGKNFTDTNLINGRLIGWKKIKKGIAFYLRIRENGILP